MRSENIKKNELFDELFCKSFYLYVVTLSYVVKQPFNSIENE